ncbi:PfkB domain-containing protein [Sulfuricella denitrificans skB26]|uniref:PfkB domain-containing protein n=1 Tax=Sulfuricella denitrificans (strain DSM 22764 / NBRC 105220 / skB26) TaxID=1163617 RepID=S6AKA2_SULDS|nr:carbohydrate kinase [Sulfuricella denitrificans]BAN35029.1 PfkB domain-containing protein [Sulfuricella denitrificans skB26]
MPRLLIKPSSRTGTIALFGEVLVDRFPDRSVLGGAPFNVARHLQAFGLHPVLITRTGNDALREELLASMARFGMDPLGVQCDPVHPTGQVVVHMEQGGYRFEISPNQAYDFIHAGVARMVALSTQPELIYFGTLAQRNKISRRALNSLFRSIGAPRMLDINLREPWYDAQTLKRSLLRADLVKMNHEELANIALQLKLPGDSAVEQAAALIKQFSLGRLLVTCGAKGAWQLTADGTETQTEGSVPTGSIVDTVGAGDGFAAVFILGTLRGWPAGLTLSRANRFAAAVCGIRGAIPDDPSFYQAFLKEWKLDDGLDKKRNHPTLSVEQFARPEPVQSPGA